MKTEHLEGKIKGKIGFLEGEKRRRGWEEKSFIIKKSLTKLKGKACKF
jgi:hypothetical protein